jgi:hypothetical protein
MRFDEIDCHASPTGRIGHSKFEKSIDIAGFSIGETAPDQEIRTLLTNRTHFSSPQSLLNAD